MVTNKKNILLFFLIISFIIQACSESDGPKPQLQLSSVQIGSYALSLVNSDLNNQAPLNQPLTITFSSPVDASEIASNIQLKAFTSGSIIPLTFSLSNQDKTLAASPELLPNNKYELTIGPALTGSNGEVFPGITLSFSTIPEMLKITSLVINGAEAVDVNPIKDAPIDFTTDLLFSQPLDELTVTTDLIRLLGPFGFVPINLTLSDANKKLSISSIQPLTDLARHQLLLSSQIKGVNGETFTEFKKYFYTAVDPAPDFPVVTDEELLTLIQQQTFKYFWDYAEPNSGMARERTGSGNLVTSGGTGFGIMALIVGVERNFVARNEGVQRMDKIVSFLETADRFHGAWSHWVNGSTGKVIPFSTKDNGGDLVETSFLVQGLLTFRQYLQPTDTIGNNLINRITALWEGVEWDWYRRGDQNVLYWHWSPNYNWDMNFALSGYFEEQITYLLAAASPTHSIPKIVYTNGFAQNGAIVRNDTYYGIPLKLGGLFPLFWVHYSYLGLDPHFTDGYADYWQQNVNATLINYQYCVTNPKHFVAYGTNCWGLTSSDNQNGYSAHSPTNDLGVISPTAALSSFPYTPEQSMDALKFYYYSLGDRLWGEYGFYDAFNISVGWTANSYLAIDQGPIIVMIENYRTGLLWNLFMSAPEVQQGADRLGFIITN